MPIYIFVSYQKCQEFLLILAGLHLRLQGVNSKDRSAMHISVACVLLDYVSGLDSLQLCERDTFTPAVCPRSYCTDQFPRLRQETKSVVQKDIVEELIFFYISFLKGFCQFLGIGSSTKDWTLFSCLNVDTQVSRPVIYSPTFSTQHSDLAFWYQQSFN